MVTTAPMGVVPGLVAVNAGISPVPLVARPTVVLLFVHKKVVPVTTGLETNVIGAPTVLQ